MRFGMPSACTLNSQMRTSSHASSYFDRLILLKLLQLEKANDQVGIVKFYYDKLPHFERHAQRGEVHLKVAQALRNLAMYAEADVVLQKGLGGRTAELEKDATARIYREMASNYREQNDVFRLGEILKHLDARYPKKFDDPECRLSKAYHARINQKNEQARKILVYAINGPDSRQYRPETEVIE